VYARSQSRATKKNVGAPVDGHGQNALEFGRKTAFARGTPLAMSRHIVDITLTSTLTAEDESIIAPAILKAVTNILDHLPIAYRVRIDTIDCQSYMASGPDRQRLTDEGRFRPSTASPLFES
jgi:hypothetical protein